VVKKGNTTCGLSGGLLSITFSSVGGCGRIFVAKKTKRLVSHDAMTFEKNCDLANRTRCVNEDDESNKGNKV